MRIYSEMWVPLWGILLKLVCQSQCQLWNDRKSGITVRTFLLPLNRGSGAMSLLNIKKNLQDKVPEALNLLHPSNVKLEQNPQFIYNLLPALTRSLQELNQHQSPLSIKPEIITINVDQQNHQAQHNQQQEADQGSTGTLFQQNGVSSQSPNFILKHDHPIHARPEDISSTNSLLPNAQHHNISPFSFQTSIRSSSEIPQRNAMLHFTDRFQNDIPNSPQSIRFQQPQSYLNPQQANSFTSEQKQTNVDSVPVRSSGYEGQGFDTPYQEQMYEKKEHSGHISSFPLQQIRPFHEYKQISQFDASTLVNRNQPQHSIEFRHVQDPQWTPRDSHFQQQVDDQHVYRINQHQGSHQQNYHSSSAPQSYLISSIQPSEFSHQNIKTQSERVASVPYQLHSNQYLITGNGQTHQAGSFLHELSRHVHGINFAQSRLPSTELEHIPNDKQTDHFSLQHHQLKEKPASHVFYTAPYENQIQTSTNSNTPNSASNAYPDPSQETYYPSNSQIYVAPPLDYFHPEKESHSQNNINPKQMHFYQNQEHSPRHAASNIHSVSIATNKNEGMRAVPILIHKSALQLDFK